MFCNTCGKEVRPEAEICVHCGCRLTGNNPAPKQFVDGPKAGIGVLCGFLGLIGLIVGLCAYPANTVARRSFLKAWGITMGCIAVVTIVAVIIVCHFYLDLLDQYLYV